MRVPTPQTTGEPGQPRWTHLFLDTPRAAFEEAVTFWSTVTGWTPSERRGESGQFLTLLPGEGPAWVRMQAVEGAAGVHLDLDSTDRTAAVARAAALGATHAWTYEDVEVVRSPGGLLVCHTVLDGATCLVRGGDALLDQVCIDVPRARWEAETAFWSAVTGTGLDVLDATYARLDQQGRPRILLQRLDEADGPVRAHPDLAVRDREATTLLHTRSGAEVLAVQPWWTVLRAPGGQVYCLTDREPGTGRPPED